MPVLILIPGRDWGDIGAFSALLRETPEQTRLDWMDSIDTEYKRWETSGSNNTDIVPKIEFIVRDATSQLNIQASDALYPTSQYPASYRIPLATLSSLSTPDCVARAVRFAVGSLMFTILTCAPPFEEFDDEEVQNKYSIGCYPDAVNDLPESVMIKVLGHWSREFEEKWAQSATAATIAKGAGLPELESSHPDADIFRRDALHAIHMF